jgi:hypothetical protein
MGMMRGAAMDVDAEVQRCVRLMTETNWTGFNELAQALVAGGVTEIEAEALIALVPIGFAHAALVRMGVGVPSDFLIRNHATGENVRAALSDDPIFRTANHLARSMLAEPSTLRKAANIVGASAEWTTLRTLCPDGDYSSCVLAESVLMRVPLAYLQPAG